MQHELCQEKVTQQNSPGLEDNPEAQTNQPLADEMGSLVVAPKRPGFILKHPRLPGETWGARKRRLSRVRMAELRQKNNPNRIKRRTISEITKDFITENCIRNQETQCLEWQRSTNSGGYGNTSQGEKPVTMHRKAYELWVGPIPEGLCICHHCDNPPCCNAEHLFIGTKKANSDDKVKKGRHIQGTSVPTSKLTREQVLIIRSRKMTPKEVSQNFGLSRKQSWSVTAGRTYRNVV
jgi:hypothetical protein